MRGRRGRARTYIRNSKRVSNVYIHFAYFRCNVNNASQILYLRIHKGIYCRCRYADMSVGICSYLRRKVRLQSTRVSILRYLERTRREIFERGEIVSRVILYSFGYTYYIRYELMSMVVCARDG